MSDTGSHPTRSWPRVIVTCAPLVIALLFLLLAIQETQLASTAPQVKLENCSAYYIGDPMAKDCPARNAAASQAAAQVQAKARAALPADWTLAVVVSLAALALSLYLSSHWGTISAEWRKKTPPNAGNG